MRHRTRPLLEGGGVSLWASENPAPETRKPISGRLSTSGVHPRMLGLRQSTPIHQLCTQGNVFEDPILFSPSHQGYTMSHWTANDCNTAGTGALPYFTGEPLPRAPGSRVSSAELCVASRWGVRPPLGNPAKGCRTYHDNHCHHTPPVRVSRLGHLVCYLVPACMQHKNAQSQTLHHRGWFTMNKPAAP